MRTLSPASLAAIQQPSGIEPVLIVRVYWGGTTYTSYCDRKFETEGLVGKLIDVSGIEDIVDINSSANSVNMSVTLDDSDGSLKDIYDYNDIHRVYVQVLQWFSSLPISEAFLIFEGEVSSPIIWSEGARTLKFDIVTKLLDREVGFSVEEGKFPFYPVNLIGVSWPIIFGTAAGAKALRLNETPTAILGSGFGLVGEVEWQKEIDGLQANVTDLLNKERAAYQTGIGNALKAAQFKAFNSGFFAEDPAQADQYDTAASSYFNQSSTYAEERIRLQAALALKLEEREFQRGLQFRVVPITQTNLPSGITLTVQINNYTMNALVIGNSMIISNLAQIRDVNILTGPNTLIFAERVNEYNKEPVDPKFTWFDGGTEIKIFNFPRYFIASIGAVTVLNVWAKNKYGRAVVPREWYQVVHENLGGGLIITKIIIPTPLESYPGGWQDGDLEIDAVNTTVGSNTVDIMRWAIVNYSGFGIDEASFATVRAQVDPFPANFVLTERKNVVEFLKEIAFQSRCAIWINDRKFFLRFLPVALTAVETVVDSDVEVGSVQITSVESERLVTKFIAEWRDRVNQETSNKIVFRYNVAKYGINEETYNFYIYRTRALVEIAAQFWMIRKSSTWKIIQCKLHLNKLRIEAFDPVEFTFSENLVATGPITGIVQKATFNSEEDTIELEAWLPVRLGEMTQYNFAYPGDTSDVYPPITDPNIQTGNPFQDAFGQIAPEISFPPHWPMTYSHADYRSTNGRGEPANETPPAPSGPAEVVTALATSPVLTTRPDDINNFNNTLKAEVKPITEFEFTALKPGTWFAFVRTKKTDVLYTCDVYMKGLFNDPTPIDVNIGYVAEGETISDGYPIEVHRTIYLDENQVPPTLVPQFWAQPPIWAPTSVPDP